MEWDRIIGCTSVCPSVCNISCSGYN